MNKYKMVNKKMVDLGLTNLIKKCNNFEKNFNKIKNKLLSYEKYNEHRVYYEAVNLQLVTTIFHRILSNPNGVTENYIYKVFDENIDYNQIVFTIKMMLHGDLIKHGEYRCAKFDYPGYGINDVHTEIKLKKGTPYKDNNIAEIIKDKFIDIIADRFKKSELDQLNAMKKDNPNIQNEMILAIMNKFGRNIDEIENTSDGVFLDVICKLLNQQGIRFRVLVFARAFQCCPN